MPDLRLLYLVLRSDLSEKDKEAGELLNVACMVNRRPQASLVMKEWFKDYFDPRYREAYAARESLRKTMGAAANGMNFEVKIMVWKSLRGGDENEGTPVYDEKMVWKDVVEPVPDVVIPSIFGDKVPKE
jgi:hypothetical protein